ncbi:MAG: hypothetical protein R3B45_15190 [Bdellovibrionota bacterium]
MFFQLDSEWVLLAYMSIFDPLRMWRYWGYNYGNSEFEHEYSLID